VRHQLGEQRGPIAVRARLHADERALQPVHLAVLAQIQRTPAGDRMDTCHRLALRPLVRRKRAGRLARQYGIAAAVGAEADMQALERIDARLQCRRQRLVGSGAIGEQGLTLAPGHRLHREEQRDVGRRTTVALIGMPAAAMRELHGQHAVRGQRRVGLAWRGTRGRWRIGDEKDLGDVGVDHVRWGKRLAVVLDLRAEDARDAHQQLRRIGHRLHVLHQQQA
jgi:hypothetical protein